MSKSGKNAGKGAGGKGAAPSRQNPPERISKTEVRRKLFVAEYLIDLNGKEAAIRAGYDPSNARAQASELLRTPAVKAMIDKALDDRINRTKLEQDEVIGRLSMIAKADPRELTELYRGCCRYCHGTDHKFQRTPREMEEAREGWEKGLAEAAKKAGMPLEEAMLAAPFKEQGGVGFNPHNDPHPKCPECFGHGKEYTHFKDTRDLSPEARMLFAGVKETQHGLQVMMHDKLGALKLLGEHHGAFRKKVEHDFTDGLADRLRAARERSGGR